MFERIFIAGKPRQRRSSFRSVRTWSLLRGSVLPPVSTPERFFLQSRRPEQDQCSAMEQWPCHAATREPGARGGGRSRHPGRGPRGKNPGRAGGSAPSGTSAPSRGRGWEARAVQRRSGDSRRSCGAGAAPGAGSAAPCRHQSVSGAHAPPRREASGSPARASASPPGCAPDRLSSRDRGPPEQRTKDRPGGPCGVLRGGSSEPGRSPSPDRSGARGPRIGFGFRCRLLAGEGDLLVGHEVSSTTPGGTAFP